MVRTNKSDKANIAEGEGRLALEAFTSTVLERTLYPYQMEIVRAVLDSVFGHKGLTFSVLLARQMGKNEISALIEAYILTHEKEGTIVKAAPTYKPQIVNSRLRLLSMLERPQFYKRVWRAEGYIIGYGPSTDVTRRRHGPRVMFLSAGPAASIVGATASLLLEVDEAQDVSVEKFNTDLRPMAATKNCTTVLYGTAWSDDTLLAQVKTTNQELEEQDGIRRHFEYDWRTLAAISPDYKAFVESEMQRLGDEHLTIRTQYRLQTISSAGLLLNERQRHMLRGIHYWLDVPDEDDIGYYVAGLDVGGEARLGQSKGLIRGKRDSTILTIARVVWNELHLPSLQIVHQVQWTGKPYLEQYAQCVALCELWNIRRLVIDKTGLGEGMTSLLQGKLGEEKVVPFHFTRQSKSKLTYQLLALIDSGRLKMYNDNDAPDDIRIEAWKQLKLARCRVPGENLLDMYVAPDEGHDDYLISIALCCEAAGEKPKPTFYSVMIPPPPLYPYDGPY
jgi:hypothetical protein